MNEVLSLVNILELDPGYPRSFDEFYEELDESIEDGKALNVRVDEVFEQIEKDETNQWVITKQDDLWDFVCEYDEMEPDKKKRLLSYMMALLKVERDKNDGVLSEE